MIGNSHQAFSGHWAELSHAYLIFQTLLWGGLSYFHFLEEETDAQRSWETCPRSLSPLAVGMESVSGGLPRDSKFLSTILQQWWMGVELVGRRNPEITGWRVGGFIVEATVENVQLRQLFF